MVLDIRTGEVLALANLPTYNPNNRARLNGAQLRNRVMTDNFEPGSTLKPFTIGLAMEMGKITPQSVIQTSPGTLTIANYTIHDAHPGGAMTVSQVIQKSSNVGAAKIALTLPREDMHDMFRRAGFGAAPRLGFPGEAAGRLREAKTWRPIEQATMAYGHGISVSLIQLARAYTVFARDGELAPLSLVKTETPAQGERVFSPAVAQALREMLEAAVQPGGTAPRARIVGWRVGGKTGTRAQAGERRLRGEQVRLLVRRVRAGFGAAPGDRGDGGRAFRRPVLRRRGRRAGVLAGNAGRAAAAGSAVRRAARSGRAAGRGRRGEGEHLIDDLLALLRGAAIEHLTSDSRRAAPGTAFFAWPGASADGRRHIAQAIERGCAAVLWESEGFSWDSRWTVPNVVNRTGEGPAHAGRPDRAQRSTAGLRYRSGSAASPAPTARPRARSGLPPCFPVAMRKRQLSEPWVPVFNLNWLRLTTPRLTYSRCIACSPSSRRRARARWRWKCPRTASTRGASTAFRSIARC